MSQYPPPPPPYDPLAYASPRQSRRPTSVTVIAIIAIVFGSLVILGSLCAIPQMLGFEFASNPITEKMREDSIYLAVSAASAVIGLGLGIGELIGGIGALSLRPGARRTLIVFAWADLATSIFFIVVQLVVVNPRMEKLMAGIVASNPSLRTPQAQMIMKASMYGGWIFTVVTLIWPILIIRFMNRGHVKAAFSSEPPPVGDYYQP
jgi:hypothetical protein